MSGELQGVRAKKDRFEKQLREGGASPEYAAKKAREQAVRHDRLRREGRIKNPNYPNKTTS